MDGDAARRDAKSRVVARALELGFDLIGVAAAEPFAQTRSVFERRAAEGMLGQWRFPPEKIARHTDPSQVLAGARSIVCTAMAYATADVPHDPYAPGLRGAVSRHSWGDDYHRVIGGKLRQLATWIQSEFSGETALACVDTGPLVDRAAAVRAGLGWYGKNANVLTREHGSWVLLGELITTLDLLPDEPLAKNCGECRVCIDRCPTGAIGADGAIDARRCISDLTQLKTPIPIEFRAQIGNRIWGCDDCQTFCPVNERKERGADCMRGTFAPLPEIGTSVDLPSVLLMTKSRYKKWFKPTSMAWRGKAVLQRNAAVALGNSRDARAVEPLIQALSDRKPIVRGHAAWSLGQLGPGLNGDETRVALRELLEREHDAWVRSEAEAALARLGAPGAVVTER
ncbi:MAG TPA: tRNA epoxyqueuosine(34) reductase QueG [Candidatus Eremiobacteraceae bacterium]|nr:tRNA epoxyqueuosine(34) reductase QueG [Candidatus Eremiobacteraceae bacterium]